MSVVPFTPLEERLALPWRRRGLEPPRFTDALRAYGAAFVRGVVAEIEAAEAREAGLLICYGNQEHFSALIRARQLARLMREGLV